jgi:hypothetical protein
VTAVFDQTAAVESAATVIGDRLTARLTHRLRTYLTVRAAAGPDSAATRLAARALDWAGEDVLAFEQDGLLPADPARMPVAGDSAGGGYDGTGRRTRPQGGRRPVVEHDTPPPPDVPIRRLATAGPPATESSRWPDAPNRPTPPAPAPRRAAAPGGPALAAGQRRWP